MENQNHTTKNCFSIDETITRVTSSDISTHIGKAFREVLLGVRSAVNRAIEKKEGRSTVKVEKVTIE